MGYDAASYGSAAGYDANAAYYSYAYAGYPYGYDYSQYAQAVPQAAQGSEQANKYREKTEVDPLLAGIQEVNVADELRKAQTAPPASMKRTFAQFVGAEAVQSWLYIILCNVVRKRWIWIRRHRPRRLAQRSTLPQSTPPHP